MTSRLRDGLEIAYRVRPLLGIPVTWREPGHRLDPPHGSATSSSAARTGAGSTATPSAGEGDGTRVADEVDVRGPVGPLGEVVTRRRSRRSSRDLPLPRRDDPERLRRAERAAPSDGRGRRRHRVRRGRDRRRAPPARARVSSSCPTRRAAARGGLPDAMELRTADVRPATGWSRHCAGPTRCVIALAFQNSPIEAPRKHQTFMEVDAAGTERLVAAAREAGVRRVVYISGAGAAPDAKRHWFRAKWRAEEAVRGSGIELDDHPPDLDLRAARRVAQPLRRVRPAPVHGPDDEHRLAAAGAGLHRRRGRLAADALTVGAAATRSSSSAGPRRSRCARSSRPRCGSPGCAARSSPGRRRCIKLGGAAAQLAADADPDARRGRLHQPAGHGRRRRCSRRVPRRLTPLEEGLATYLSPPARPVGWRSTPVRAVRADVRHDGAGGGDEIGGGEVEVHAAHPAADRDVSCASAAASTTTGHGRDAPNGVIAPRS